jgi:hypothetical protein
MNNMLNHSIRSRGARGDTNFDITSWKKFLLSNQFTFKWHVSNSICFFSNSLWSINMKRANPPTHSYVLEMGSSTRENIAPCLSSVASQIVLKARKCSFNSAGPYCFSIVFSNNLPISSVSLLSIVV